MDGYMYEPSPYGAMINRALETHTNLGYTFSIVEMIVSPTRTEGYQQQVIRSFTSNVKVDDAVLIDTTNLTITEVVEKMTELIKKAEG